MNSGPPWAFGENVKHRARGNIIQRCIHETAMENNLAENHPEEITPLLGGPYFLSPPPTSPPEDFFPCILIVDELASHLRVNRNTVYKATAGDQIPGVRKIGRKIQISRDTTLEWPRRKDHVLRSERSTR